MIGKASAMTSVQIEDFSTNYAPSIRVPIWKTLHYQNGIVYYLLECCIEA